MAVLALLNLLLHLFLQVRPLLLFAFERFEVEVVGLVVGLRDGVVVLENEVV